MTLVALGFAAACSHPATDPAPLRVTATPSGPDTRLTLRAEAGLKINARLPPALELGGGTILRFRTGLRTADSAYYAEPPSAVLPGLRRVRATLVWLIARGVGSDCRARVLGPGGRRAGKGEHTDHRQHRREPKVNSHR